MRMIDIEVHRDCGLPYINFEAEEGYYTCIECSEQDVKLNDVQIVFRDDLIKLCLAKMNEEPKKHLQGDWNEAFKLILKELNYEI